MGTLKCDLRQMLNNLADALDEDGGVAAGFEVSIITLVGHIDQVRAGSVSLDAFADFYMLRPDISDSYTKAEGAS